MNIILVSNNLAKARTLTLTSAHLVLLAAGFVLAAVLLAMALNYLSLRYADKIDSPTLRSLVLSVQAEEHQKTQSYLRDSLNAMAVRMGQMQAQLLRLDSVGARLSELSGIKPQEFLFNQNPGQGGVTSSQPSQDMSLLEIAQRTGCSRGAIAAINRRFQVRVYGGHRNRWDLTTPFRKMQETHG